MTTFKSKILGATAIAALVCTVGTANAANLLFPDYGDFKDTKITGSTFTSELAREYQNLSIYEYVEEYDYFDAETYAERGKMAKSGKAPQPFMPEDWDIDDASAMKDLKSARVELVNALDKGAPTAAPDLAADAQAKYDCWVEQQEEGWQDSHIAACRDGFRNAMERLWAAMTPPEPVEAAAVEEPVVAAAPQMTIDSEVIYFDFDKATLNTQGQSTIDVLSARLKGLNDISIHVKGHTDRAGAADYNQKLADRRAETVRAALIGHGLNVSEVEEFVVDAEGETKPAVATGDGVREALNRRVEIVVKGKFKQALIDAGTNDVAAAQ